MIQSWDFDVAVVGGGPAGAVAASALARNDRRVLVLERERFPRFHIGESQLPWIHEVLARIGAEKAIAAAGFVEKWGASFTTADSEADQYADFSQALEVPNPRAFQVSRGSFDQILLEHAASCGAVVLQGRTAVEAVFDDNGVSLTYSDAGGDQTRVTVGAIIDASGRAGFLAKRFGERHKDPILQNIAVHRQYEGVPRREGRRAGDIQMVTRPDKGWFWFIPINETTTSVGVVIPPGGLPGCGEAHAGRDTLVFRRRDSRCRSSPDERETDVARAIRRRLLISPQSALRRSLRVGRRRRSVS